MSDSRLLCASFILLASASASAQDPASSGVVENSPRLCQNGEDDDGDGLTDCDDDGCGQLIFCLHRDTPTEGDATTCANGDDDDGDGFVDCEDDGCAAECRTSLTLGHTEGRSIYQPRVADEPPPTVEFVEHESGRNYPVAWARHPMTLRRGMLVPRLAFSAQPIRTPGFGDETLARLGLGLSYGVFDFWQITIVPVPLRLSPVVDYENPSVASTFELFAIPEFELGLTFNVGIPVGTSSSNAFPEPQPLGSLLSRARYYDVAHLDMGLLARFHIEDLVRIDLQVPVATLIFASNALGELDVRADLSFIGRVGVSITKYAYLGLWSGLTLAGPGYDAPRVPFGFFAGAMIPGWRRGPAVDLGLRFGWPILYDGGAPAGTDAVDPSFWQLTFDVRIFSWLLP